MIMISIQYKAYFVRQFHNDSIGFHNSFLRCKDFGRPMNFRILNHSYETQWNRLKTITHKKGLFSVLIYKNTYY